MEEAEALCSRIAIMVKGQLRALGTKQHLKEKFGSGYELCIKLLVSGTGVDPSRRIHEATSFVSSLFPHSTLISENGGLVTYQIPKEEMKMGLAFTQLEANKANLGIEDYSIAQPTLEQVFIRTVVNNSEENGGRKVSRASLVPATMRGSLHQSVELLTDPNGEVVEEATGDYEYKEPVNPCGCTRSTVWKFTLPFTFLFLLFEGLFIGLQVSVLMAFALITLIVACVGCNMLCCPCCQPAKGADE